MLLIPLPEGRKLSFYLAAEEYVAKHVRPNDDAWMVWQVAPSVICGRNQDIEAEVNLPYCREHGIGVFRRKSGGGCVYADMGNIMYTMIAPSDQVAFTYHRFVEMLLLLLRDIGITATHTGRNDILVDGHKVSGTAFQLLTDYSIAHSTMLFDADMHNMVNAITPSRQKLDSHGVKSVSQRITLLKDHTDVTPQEFVKLSCKRLGQEVLPLTDADIRAIEQQEGCFCVDF